MTPARLAEIRAYIQRLDLNQLPGWTIEQRIIADLWSELPEAWEEGYAARVAYEKETGEYRANSYRDGEQQ